MRYHIRLSLFEPERRTKRNQTVIETTEKTNSPKKMKELHNLMLNEEENEVQLLRGVMLLIVFNCCQGNAQKRKISKIQPYKFESSKVLKNEKVKSVFFLRGQLRTML